MAMITHRIVARHSKLFALRFGRLLEDWQADIDEQRKLINHRYSDEDTPSPIATMNLDREQQLRDRVQTAINAVFVDEHWMKL